MSEVISKVAFCHVCNSDKWHIYDIGWRCTACMDKAKAKASPATDLDLDDLDLTGLENLILAANKCRVPGADKAWPYALVDRLPALIAKAREADAIRAQLATTHARIAELEAADDPDYDCTDFAHPAWWRGHHHTTGMFCHKLNEILDGKDDGSGVSSEPWESTRRRLLELVRRVKELEVALRSAESALAWGHVEMKGRPPQHWLDAIAHVALALHAQPKEQTNG